MKWNHLGLVLNLTAPDAKEGLGASRGQKFCFRSALQMTAWCFVPTFFLGLLSRKWTGGAGNWLKIGFVWGKQICTGKIKVSQALEGLQRAIFSLEVRSPSSWLESLRSRKIFSFYCRIIASEVSQLLVSDCMDGFLMKSSQQVLSWWLCPWNLNVTDLGKDSMTAWSWSPDIRWVSSVSSSKVFRSSTHQNLRTRTVHP